MCRPCAGNHYWLFCIISFLPSLTITISQSWDTKIIHTMKLGNGVYMKVGDLPLCSPLTNSVSPFITTIITIIRSLTSRICAFCILCTSLFFGVYRLHFYWSLGLKKGNILPVSHNWKNFLQVQPFTLIRGENMIKLWNYMLGYIVDVWKVNSLKFANFFL